jgi:hypothetical protein
MTYKFLFGPHPIPSPKEKDKKGPNLLAFIVYRVLKVLSFGEDLGGLIGRCSNLLLQLLLNNVCDKKPGCFETEKMQRSAGATAYCAIY